MLLMMNESIARNMYNNQRIINYPTQLHILGHFRNHDAWKYEYQVHDFKFASEVKF